MGAAHSASGPRRGGHRTGVASASSESRERQQRRSAAQQAADDVSLRGPIAVEWPHERGRKPFEAHPKVRMRSRTKAAAARLAKENRAFDAANPRVEWTTSMTTAAEARKAEAQLRRLEGERLQPVPKQAFHPRPKEVKLRYREPW